MTDAITGLGPTAGSVEQATEANSIGGLDSDAFLKLLVAQLRYQNPMQPTDGTAMLQQTAQFTQVETLKQLAASQQKLLGYHQTVVASGMVGREVTIAEEDGTQTVGIVDALRFTADGPLLIVGGREIEFDRVVEVRPAPITDSTTDTTTDSTTDSATDGDTTDSTTTA